MINILVVEDDAKLNRIVCTYLNDNGFHATGCLNANKAYDEMYNSDELNFFIEYQYNSSCN